MEEVLSDQQLKANVAENLTRLLQSRGWSQRDLARESGETPMTVSRLCRGDAVPHLGTIHRIAEALETSIDKLAGPAPAKNSTAHLTAV